MTDLPGIGAELLSVSLAGQQYAIDIMSVREIRGWTTSTPIPHSPPHVIGMINLRGVVLPVIDLARRLGVGQVAPEPSSVVVVVLIGTRQVGLLVDGVCDILRVTENLIQPAPDVGAPEIHEFVRGVMTTEAGIVSLLSLEQVLPPDLQAAA